MYSSSRESHDWTSTRFWSCFSWRKNELSYLRHLFALRKFSQSSKLFWFMFELMLEISSHLNVIELWYCRYLESWKANWLWNFQNFSYQLSRLNQKCEDWKLSWMRLLESQFDEKCDSLSSTSWLAFSM